MQIRAGLEENGVRVMHIADFLVEAMKKLLRAAGVSDADVRSEQFYGY